MERQTRGWALGLTATFRTDAWHLGLAAPQAQLPVTITHAGRPQVMAHHLGPGTRETLMEFPAPVLGLAWSLLAESCLFKVKGNGDYREDTDVETADVRGSSGEVLDKAA